MTQRHFARAAEVVGTISNREERVRIAVALAELFEEDSSSRFKWDEFFDRIARTVEAATCSH